jgi:hypothetical protein
MCDVCVCDVRDAMCVCVMRDVRVRDACACAMCVCVCAMCVCVCDDACDVR